MKVTLESQVTITAKQPAVFKYLSHLKYHFLWNPHLQSLLPLTSLKQGTVYKTKSILLGISVSGTNKVTKFVNNNELELENNTGTLRYKVNYSLHRHGNKTALICTTIISTENNAFTFTAPVLKMLARRELQADLQALKIAVEQRLGV